MMSIIRLLLLPVLLLCCCLHYGEAFSSTFLLKSSSRRRGCSSMRPPKQQHYQQQQQQNKDSSSSSSSCQFMVPKYDGTQWVPMTNDDLPDAGYPPTQTLLLHGPKPYLHRLFQSNDYEQAVLKYMANEKCSRIVAQGNMDKYLDNPNDWAFDKFESKRTGIVRDYWTLKKDKVAFTLIWTVIVFAYAGVAIYSLTTGTTF